MSSNKITILPELKQPQLFKLNLNENLITSAAQFTGHVNLRILELKKNKLTSCEGLSNLDALEELYLNENEITNIRHIRNMPNLKKLDLNTNKLDSFKEPPTLPALEHLDLGANVIVGADTITHLSDFKKLRNIVVAGNPFADELADKLK